MRRMRPRRKRPQREEGGHELHRIDGDTLVLGLGGPALSVVGLEQDFGSLATQHQGEFPGKVLNILHGAVQAARQRERPGGRHHPERRPDRDAGG